MKDSDVRFATELTAVLERIEHGGSVSTEWLQDHYPEAWADLAGALSAAETLAADDGSPRRLGRYELGRWLGRGGMGTVYEARTGDAPGRLAVKVFHAHLCAKPRFLEHVRGEVALGRRIDHPNVIRTLDAGVAEGSAGPCHYVVLEFLDGQTLRSLLDTTGRLPEDLCRHVAREAAEGLAAIHAAGAVHRDLKPENLLITRGEFLKLTDLGAAYDETPAVGSARRDGFHGTVPYAAPEQFSGNAADVDGRTDLFALGIVLYELVTGVHPFADRPDWAMSAGESPPQAPSELDARVSPFFEALILRLLERRPEDRFESARELARVLAAGEESPWWREFAGTRRAGDRRTQAAGEIHGRDAELALLRRLVGEAAGGSGRVVLVTGDAGIGKSRLVAEVASGLGSGFLVLRAAFSPGGPVADGLVGALREHFAADGGKLRLEEALAETPLLLPAAARLLHDAPGPAGASAAAADTAATIVVRLLRSLADRRPVFVTVEDLHFAPGDGRSLILSVARAIAGMRVALVATARPREAGAQLDALRGLPGVAEVVVGPLDAVAIGRIVSAALGSSSAGAATAPPVAARADGNPLFALETVRGLRDAGVLRRRLDGTWEVRGSVAAVPPPPTLRALIDLRLHALDGSDRDLLAAAACCGFEFDSSIVAEALGLGGLAVARRLARIGSESGVVRPSGPRHVFEHHLFQEVLYEGLSEARRREVHACVGEALERRTAPGGEASIEICRHLLAGGLGHRATAHLWPALERLAATFRCDAAVRLAEQAEALPGLLTARELAELLLQSSVNLRHLGRRSEQAAVVRRACDAAAASGDASLRSRAAFESASHMSAGGDYEGALAMDAEAAALAREAGDVRHAAIVLIDAAHQLMNLGRFGEARDRLVGASSLQPPPGDPLVRAMAGCRLGWLAIHTGELEGARREYETALDLARQAGDAAVEATALGGLGTSMKELGRIGEALALQQQYLDLSVRSGNRNGTGMAHSVIADLLMILGRREEAILHLDRQVSIGREIGRPVLEGNALGNMGVALAGLGRYAEALSCYGRYLEISRNHRHVTGEVYAMANASDVLRTVGAIGPALEHAERALATARSIGMGGVEPWLRRQVGEALDASGEPDLAGPHFSADVDAARASGARLDLACALARRGAHLMRRGRADEATADLAESVETCREIGQHAEATVPLALLAALGTADADEAIRGLAQFESQSTVQDRLESRYWLWRATHDREQLAEAHRLLVQLRRCTPPEYQTSILENVAIHREIMTAFGAPAHPADA